MEHCFFFNLHFEHIAETLLNLADTLHDNFSIITESNKNWSRSPNDHLPLQVLRCLLDCLFHSVGHFRCGLPFLLMGVMKMTALYIVGMDGGLRNLFDLLNSQGLVNGFKMSKLKKKQCSVGFSIGNFFSKLTFFRVIPNSQALYLFLFDKEDFMKFSGKRILFYIHEAFKRHLSENQILNSEEEDTTLFPPEVLRVQNDGVKLLGSIVGG
ncbi:hypothetical protein ROZALSC1DRAFT_25187 [Rozella allomycis CSF55]|uniref:Uncharacterized protein n=1 Tax=Rozella allomycis (strain CSF55) TaxID=988480 RepID=A0A4P9YC03_ROZAC|nr:hypothetical protein ROZALSC1DRAFT_25187 [Rozella allomycis CSF55]